MRLCDPAGTRTQDPYIKSVLLYQLSYETNILKNCVLNYFIWLEPKDPPDKNGMLYQLSYETITF